jgi:hypothetical protein
MFETLGSMLGPVSENGLTSTCGLGDCSNALSPFLFAVCGPSPSDLSICCVECAEELNEPITRVYRMVHKRALVWLGCAGRNRTVTCAACGLCEHPIDVLDDWEMGHKRAAATGGKCLAENQFPVHRKCNREMGTLSLDSVRSLSGMSHVSAFPNQLDNVSAKKALKRLSSLY